MCDWSKQQHFGKPDKYIPMKYILFVCLISAGALFGQNTPVSTNFDDNWKFHLGNASDPAKDFNYGISNLFAKTGVAEKTPMDAKFDDKNWKTVQLPHDWVEALPFEDSPNFDVMAHGYKPIGGLYPQNCIGWYRKEFNVAKSDSGSRFVLQFDGIFRDSKIWVNGFYVGNNLSGYIGASYDVTDFLNFGGKNIVTVRVDASQYEGWFYEGAGIYRHVWLNKLNVLHFNREKYVIRSELKDRTATVAIETNLRLSHSEASNTLLYYSYITDREGHIIAKTPEAHLVALDGRPQQMELRDPQLWSPDDPYLYRVITLLKSNNRTIDSLSTRIGIRTIAMDAVNGLTVNGKPVKIKGVCCHQDHAGVGSALPDYLQYYRIRLLKEMGVNAYRTSHNPPTPELLDACDSLGMLVLDENRLLNSSPENLDQFRRLISRDRNHPSVFMWSIGNEEWQVQTGPIGKRIAQTLIQLVKENDPTRTCTYAADVADVYSGINSVIPVRGFNYRILGVDPYHKGRPDQPIVGTEMGSTVTTRGIYEKDTVRAYVPDQDITAPWWANTAEAWWTLAADRPFWMGGFVWTGFDYRGEPTPYKWPNINSHFGIMDMCGFPKNIYYYYQSWWADKDVMHISPHWNWKGKEGKPVDVWVNSNASSVELFLNGKSLGKKDMPRNKHLQWSVPYQPGTLEAVGERNGQVLKSVVETTGDPYQIVLTPDHSTLHADGKDATVINVTVLDKSGREVPDAGNLIKFSVTGDASIIGVGNGDPSSHEPDQYEKQADYQRSLFNGKCQLILQAGKTPGAIELVASSYRVIQSVVNITTTR
jgi:beta-galactosidase